MVQAATLVACAMVQFGVESVEATGRDGLKLTVRRGPDGRYELTVGREGSARSEAWGCAVQVSQRVGALGGSIATSALGALRYVG